MIVIDASVLIGHLGADDAHHARAFDVLDTEDEIGVHPVTVAEALVLPAREHRDAEVLGALDRIGIDRLAPDDAEPQRVARLRAETGLGLPDCYVLAAAERLAAGLATFDARLAAAARSRGVTVLGA